MVAPFTGAWIEINFPSSTDFGRTDVAPFTGAWIEISSASSSVSLSTCRTLHGCVDWNKIRTFIVMHYHLSHPSRVRGLKFKLMVATIVPGKSRTLHGCVDWNSGIKWVVFLEDQRRTLHGCVDWNSLCFCLVVFLNHVAPFTGAWIEINE